jgi:hypothetical protein
MVQNRRQVESQLMNAKKILESPCESVAKVSA